MYIKELGEHPYKELQAYALNDAHWLYQYLRMRGCTPVYTSLTFRDGVFKVVFGSKTPNTIIDEINRLANGRWEVKNSLKEFDSKGAVDGD